MRLSPETLGLAVAELAARDPDLAAVVERFGPPPLWARRPGFSTLVRIILEQQVSLRSATAAYARLQALAGRVTPARVAAIGERDLRAAGLTRQKAAYCRGVANAIVAGGLDLGGLDGLPDDDVRAALIELPGIGPWTADIYLLMALRRPDVWPNGDLALARALQRVKRMRRAPGEDRMARVARTWAPWRAAAARVLWHFYLSSGRS
ncbi:MAG TPA: DNA-3-methyladenine glycosylase 2 family protein [Gemmatimonadota bacterium]|nr:DNA-3-methyladenine glycosylase 2 family protein [Gemmatimonadota bacterium]